MTLAHGYFVFLRVCIINDILQPFASAAEALHFLACGKLKICSKSTAFMECVGQFCSAVGRDIVFFTDSCHVHIPQCTDDSCAGIFAMQACSRQACTFFVQAQF